MSKRKRDFLRETLLLMGPERKKSRQNTHEPVEQTTDKDQSSPNTPTAKSSATPATTETPATSNSTDSPKSASRGSWYGGAWRSKAVPLTETAKESVSVAQGVTSEALAEGGKRIPEAARRPGAFVSKSMRGSRKSIPLVAEPTRVHATSDLSDKSRPRTASGEKLRNIEGSTENKLVTKSDPKRTVEVKQPVIEEAPLPPEPAVQPTPSEEAKSVEGTPRPQSWFGWWSRPDDFDCNAQKAADNTKRQDEASSTPLPGTPGTPEDGPDAESVAPPEVAAVEEATQPGLQPEKSAKTGSSRSWFGLWSSAQNEQAAADEEAHKDGEPQQPPAPDVTISAVPEEAKDDTKADAARKDEDEQPRSSGWAFWSHDRGGKEAAPTPGGTQTQVGELAVADTPSQSHPEAAQFNQQREPEPSKAQPKKSGSLLRPKRAKASGVDLSAEAAATTTPSTPAPSTPVTETPPNTESEVPKPVQRGKAPAQSRPNLILPSFVDNYPPAPNPSYIERVTQYMAETLRLSNSAASSQHVYRSPTKPTIKKAISLGIHGFFPAPLIQKVLGQPTGTSIRFANYGAASIKSWCQDNQPEIGDVEIEKVALEGEGFIADRVNTLWKLMLNWLTHLRQADFILICCHSQGVPVAITLVAKLIQLGCLHPSAKLGVCAMAGINLGPFLDYKSRLFGGSALELFDFCDGSSKVSKSYAESLDVCLRHGVRVTYVGSLDDQLVSLESSLHTPLSHPYVNRAVFIDGRLHAPNFLTHLVIFALKLRNRGISDHGLIRELSAPLAGSLVGGEGHSRVYDDPAVYRLAIDFALESTDATSTPPPSSSSSSDAENAAFARRSSLSGYPSSTAAANHMRRGSASTALPGIGAIIAAYEPPPSAKEANPFYLPWAVRGMLEEKAVKAEMMEEVQVLVKEFEEWKPVSKVLRDVRWRLEGVKSMI